MYIYTHIIGFLPIIVTIFDIMTFRSKIKDYANVPITRHLILDLLQDYNRPNDKISELIKSGDLISLKRGLYISGKNLDLPQPEPFLIANHLRGPSYISLESALSHWGMIPERTYEISSVTIKTSKIYHTPVGRYSYSTVPKPYFSYGIKSIPLINGHYFLIASPEKALCDKIVLTSNVNLRSMSQTQDFLIDDLRIDELILRELNLSLIENWIENAPKKNSLTLLINTINKL